MRKRIENRKGYFMRKRLFAMLFVMIGLLLLGTGCGGKKEETATETTKEAETTEEEIKIAVLFIGKEGDYGRYQWAYRGELTPRKLIRGIEKTTGWNLTLNKRVTKREDGYIICFSEKSVMYMGQKNDEEDEFYIPYKEHFYQSVLDSIKKTLRYNLKEDGETMNIYYWGADDTPLTIDELKITLPMGKSYDGFKNLENVKSKNEDGTLSYEVEGTFLGMRGEEEVEMKIDGDKQTYQVTYPKLLAIFKTAADGQQMKIQITENMTTGEKLVTKIY